MDIAADKPVDVVTSGRKCELKFQPEENQLLVDLYIKNRSVYETNVPFGRSWRYAAGKTVKRHLQLLWAEKVSALGFCQRTDSSIGQRLRDLMKVARKYNTSEASDPIKPGTGKHRMPWRNPATPWIAQLARAIREPLPSLDDEPLGDLPLEMGNNSRKRKRSLENRPDDGERDPSLQSAKQNFDFLNNHRTSENQNRSDLPTEFSLQDLIRLIKDEEEPNNNNNNNNQSALSERLPCQDSDLCDPVPVVGSLGHGETSVIDRESPQQILSKLMAMSVPPSTAANEVVETLGTSHASVVKDENAENDCPRLLKEAVSNYDNTDFIASGGGGLGNDGNHLEESLDQDLRHSASVSSVENETCLSKVAEAQLSYWSTKSRILEQQNKREERELLARMEKMRAEMRIQLVEHEQKMRVMVAQQKYYERANRTETEKVD